MLSMLLYNLNKVLLRLVGLFYDTEDKTQRAPRSPQWHKLAKEHLAEEPRCQWCGSLLFTQVHHIAPFHIEPEKELDPDNLITLCMRPGQRCHLVRGHHGNFKSFNLAVRTECEQHEKKC